MLASALVTGGPPALVSALRRSPKKRKGGSSPKGHVKERSRAIEAKANQQKNNRKLRSSDPGPQAAAPASSKTDTRKKKVTEHRLIKHHRFVHDSHYIIHFTSPYSAPHL